MADFQEHLEALEASGVRTVALSVDGEEDAAATARRHGLSFPVLYGLDAREIRDRHGTYIDEEKGFLHATGFLLRDGMVRHATYSSGPLGRLQAEHVAGWVDYHRKQGDG